MATSTASGKSLVFMELEDPHDVRVHQSQIGLPFLAKTPCPCSGNNFQSNGCARQPVTGQPRRAFAATAERPVERVTIG